ncbi:MAG: hypothetical protein ABSF11_06135 [Methylocella sp.]
MEKTSLAKRQDIAPRPPRVRSAVSNGRRPFVVGDGRSPWARRHRDLIELHFDDLGGPDCLSEAQMSLCRRAATLEVELERIEGQLSLGNDADLDAYSRHAGGLRRILETLGIERRKRDVSPSLADIARRCAEAPEEAHGDDDDVDAAETALAPVKAASNAPEGSE